MPDIERDSDGLPKGKAMIKRPVRTVPFLNSNLSVVRVVSQNEAVLSDCITQVAGEEIVRCVNSAPELATWCQLLLDLMDAGGVPAPEGAYKRIKAALEAYENG